MRANSACDEAAESKEAGLVDNDVSTEGSIGMIATNDVSVAHADLWRNVVRSSRSARSR